MYTCVDRQRCSSVHVHVSVYTYVCVRVHVYVSVYYTDVDVATVTCVFMSDAMLLGVTLLPTALVITIATSLKLLVTIGKLKI